MKQDKAKRAEPRILTYIGMFLLGALAGSAGTYVMLTYSHGPGTTLTVMPADRSSIAGAERWAAPLDLPGVPNLHKVSEELYRGAQPTAEGMRRLKNMGVRTIVSLRLLHSDRDEIEGTGLGYKRIPMEAWNAEDDEVVLFLKIVGNKKRAPIFVHCKYGSDRTGTMSAIYRIVVQGWSKEDAIEEMTRGGFGFHREWQNLITYVRDLDVEEIKRRAGIKEQRDRRR